MPGLFRLRGVWHSVEVREKLILSGLVLATGVSGAMWFRKTEHSPSPLFSAQTAHTVRREEFRPNPAPVNAGAFAAPKPVPVPNTPAVTTTAPAGPISLEGTPPPALAAEYQPFYGRSNSTAPSASTTAPPFSPGSTGSTPAFSPPIQTPPPVRVMQPVPELTRPQSPVAAPPNWPAVNPYTPVPARPTAPPTLPAAPTPNANNAQPNGTTTSPRAPTLPPANPAPTFPALNHSGVTPSSYAPQVSTVRHKVADGETLAMIAEHYLGNASRRMEIFQANRNVLSDPEILPIGVELAIPVGPSPWDQ